MAEPENYKISILVPPDAQSDSFRSQRTDDAVKHHGIKDTLSSFWTRQEVDIESVRDQWEDTIKSLFIMTDSARGLQSGWVLDEVAISMSISAKGELSFIASAGLSGTVTIKLKREPQKI